jgi:ribulose-5-phosphate 4-epimerase/fuculose-1-phosphate aldolase
MTHRTIGQWDPPSLPEISLQADLALLLRALNEIGYDDVLAGHVTADLKDGTMLMNPFELAWDEVTASDIIRLDSSGRKIDGDFNPSPAVHLHTGLRRARPELSVIIHNHPRWANSWAAAGRIPAIYDQTSAQFDAELVLIDEYDGQFNLADAADRTVELFGQAHWGILANHGVLVTAPSIATAFMRCYTLEWRSRRAFEVEALGGGRAMDPQVAAAFGRGMDKHASAQWWEAARRRQLRRDPGILT